MPKLKKEFYYDLKIINNVGEVLASDVFYDIATFTYASLEALKNDEMPLRQYHVSAKRQARILTENLIRSLHKGILPDYFRISKWRTELHGWEWSVTIRSNGVMFGKCILVASEMNEKVVD